MDSIVYGDFSLLLSISMQYFSDLDDTISANTCLLYSKVKIYKQLQDYEIRKESYFANIMTSFKINKRFLALAQSKNINSVFILSRNDEDFIQYFMSYFNDNYSRQYNITIVGWKWNIWTIDKMKYIDWKWILISDMFEYQQLQWYPNFISIDTYNIVTKYQTLWYKIIYLIVFIVNFIIKK